MFATEFLITGRVSSRFSPPNKRTRTIVALSSKASDLSKNRYYLGTTIKSQLRGASYSVPCKKKDAAPKGNGVAKERRGARGKE
jgi:hypothetical protein